MKNKIFNLSFALILIALLFLLTGCQNNKEENKMMDTENKESLNDVQEEKVEETQLNSELEGVYAFAKSVEGNDKSKIVALKKDGTEVEITKIDDQGFDALDYYGGMLYLRNKEDFYEIDLSQGNGNYKASKIIGYEDTKYQTSNNQIYLYNGKLYFSRADKQIIALDLATKKSTEVTEQVEFVKFGLNKEMGMIYYQERNPQNSLKSYNLKTGETKVIDTTESEQGRYTYYYNLFLCDVSSEKIIYAKEEKEGEMRDFHYYLYDIATGQKEEINGFTEGIYSDGKVYYTAPLTEDEPYPDYDLRIYENGVVTQIGGTQSDSYTEFYDLGNGKIQAVLTWGQDVSTAGEQAYTIDKQTNEIAKAGKKYVSIHIIKEIDKGTKITYTENAEGKITVEQAEEIIKNKWGIEPQNDNQNLPEPGEYIIQGGNSNMTIRDMDGLEYYVFSYYSNVSDGSHKTHIQTMFISVDGKKYKIRAMGDNFQDGDVITEFDEEGEI